MKKALLVDDHALFREGLALLMAQAFAGVECLQASTLAEASAIGARHPDLALTLLDLGLPDSTVEDRFGGLRRLQREMPESSLVVLSGDDAPQTVLSAIEAGAQGFIPKTSRPGLMREALTRVMAGQIYLPEALLQKTPQELAVSSSVLDELSDRQLDVLRLLVQGRSNKLIGRDLDVAESTVKTHVAAVFRKLDVNTRTQAVVKAARLGLRV